MVLIYKMHTRGDNKKTEGTRVLHTIDEMN